MCTDERCRKPYTDPHACGCSVGPGKFEGEGALTYLAYQAMLHGDVDTTTYSSDQAHDWFRRPFNFDADLDAVLNALLYGYCVECIDKALADESFGLELYEDSAGFVWLNSYDTEEKYDEALQEALDEEAGVS